MKLPWHVSPGKRVWNYVNRQHAPQSSDTGYGGDATDECSRLGHRAQLPNNLVVFREPAGLVFAEDQLAVDLDVEDPAASGNEFGLDTIFDLDRIRQTGGVGEIVSFVAIGDGNVHVNDSS